MDSRTEELARAIFDRADDAAKLMKRALQRERELQEQVVSLRNELRGYREREKTMGWSQD
jgi:hypothetical protein